MKLFPLRQPSSAPRGFTIIEIALCLGIIGFALVAILAALPSGLNVQKRNREETIIGEDAGVWMSALRTGARGYDDLTNNVLCITNFWTRYNADFSTGPSGFDYYTPTNSLITSTNVPSFLLTNGARIIGLLSTPKRIPDVIDPPYQSNYVVAYVRAFSGAAVDKAPQNNATILADAFIYRMIVENFPYTPVDTNAYCLDCPATNNATPAQMTDRTNLMKTVALLQANAHDFRLLFRWPVLPSGQIPNVGFATFRSMADGQLVQTNDSDPTLVNQSLYFVQPSTFTTNAP